MLMGVVKLKKIVFAFVFVFMMSLCAINPLAFKASAETRLPVHNTDTGLDYATIQEAIDANETLNGHTIMVDAGIYNEHLVVHKAVSLIGENNSNTIVDGNNTGTVIHVIVDNVNLAGFTVQNCGNVTIDSGVSVEGSKGVKISHNILRNNSRGISLIDSGEAVLLDNEVLNSEYGIRFYHSSNNVLLGLKVSNNSRGFYLSYSDENVLSGSEISNNGEGIMMFVSNGSMIFHNNFVNNTQPVISVNSVNSWDNGMEGNYWSGYGEVDKDQDGIGDTPFVIAENNTDSFPLMGMISDFDVVYEHEIHHVSVVSNSTVSGFRFDAATMILRFNVTVLNGTVGFCRVMIPKVLINWPYVVMVDIEQINSTMLSVSNYTHSFLYFTYAPNDHTVRITSKPYYQLLERYNNILAEYQKLNLAYYDLTASFNSLNAIYQQLLSQYENLNSTYYELLYNYTQLGGDYWTLNLTYHQLVDEYNELQSSYNSLQISYSELNLTHFELISNYTELQLSFVSLNTSHSNLLNKYDFLNSSHHTLNVTYNDLVGSFNELELEYETATSQLSVLNATYTELKLKQEATTSELTNARNLMYVFLATTLSASVLLTFSMRYYRMFHQQKKVIESYKNELRRRSPFQIARILFKGDAERLEKKIKRFEHKYGVKVQPSRTLEELLKSLKLEKKVGNEG